MRWLTITDNQWPWCIASCYKLQVNYCNKTESIWVFFLTSACDGGVQRVYAEYSRNDSIFSPGYPRSYYDSRSCQWRIIASSGHRVLIYFTVFDLESCVSCSCDKVEIYDGQNQSNNRLSKSCGNSLPDPVYSTGSDIFMKFTSDYMASGRGFVAHYRVLNDTSGWSWEDHYFILVHSLMRSDADKMKYVNRCEQMCLSTCWHSCG